jgi:hypothetical protein
MLRWLKYRTLLTNKCDLNIRKNFMKCYVWSIALCGDEIWTLPEVDQKYLENF